MGASLHALVRFASSVAVPWVKFSIPVMGNKAGFWLFEALEGFRVTVPLAFSHLSARLWWEKEGFQIKASPPPSPPLPLERLCALSKSLGFPELVYSFVNPCFKCSSALILFCAQGKQSQDKFATLESASQDSGGPFAVPILQRWNNGKRLSSLLKVTELVNERSGFTKRFCNYTVSQHCAADIWGHLRGLSCDFFRTLNNNTSTPLGVSHHHLLVGDNQDCLRV